MSEQSAYDWSNDRLIDALMRAAARAGVSNSGLVISASAADDWGGAHYLAGVLRARLDGVTRPVKEGDILRPKRNPVTAATRDPGGYVSPMVTVSEPVTVRQVFYQGEGKWRISFQERHAALWYSYDDGDRIHQFGGRRIFNLRDFELVPAEVEAGGAV